MAGLALSLFLGLLLAPAWAGTTLSRVPVFTAPTTPQLARVGAILSAAQASPTAMAVLDRAAALRPGEAIPISFKDTGPDLGYFDYERGVVAISNRYAKGQARRAVPTLVHEILHVAQEEARTPAQALERELEAHALTLRILDELGLKDDNPFSAAARKRLTAGPAEFRDWMRLQLPNKFEHRPRARAEIVGELQYDLDESDRDLPGLRNDIERLSRAGWRRYKRFAAEVWKVLEAEHARLNGR